MTSEVGVVVGNRIRRRRRLLGLTQQDLGVRCAISFQQIQKYEAATSRLSVDMLWKLSRVLEVEMDYFFSGLAQEVPREPRAISVSVSPLPTTLVA